MSEVTVAAEQGSADDLIRLYHPRGLALVGATETEGPGAQQTRRLMEIADAIGAQFYPISATRTEIFGRTAHRSLAGLPGPVDVAVFQVSDPASAIIRATEEAGPGQAMPEFAIVFTSGFGELGTRDGRDREQHLTAVCAQAGMRLLGPNTNINSLEIRRRRSPLGKIGLVTQSGAQGRPLIEAEAMGIEFSYWAPTGNEADLEAADFFEFFARDSQSAAIAAYIEGFRSGTRLREAALSAIEHDVPIVLIKVGRSEIGESLAVSHTAHLAGSDAVHDAFFEQYAITRVDDLDELLEVSAALARSPAPHADGVVIYGISGGAVAHLADLAAVADLSMPVLSEQTQTRLHELIPEYLSVANPIDSGGSSVLLGHAPEQLDAILADPATGVLLCIIPGTFGQLSTALVDAIEQVGRHTTKPILVVWSSPATDADYHRLLGLGLPVFRNCRNALAAVRAVVSRLRVQSSDGAFVRAARALPPIGPAFTGDSFLLDEEASLRWLEARGVPGVDRRSVDTVEEAVAAADRLGYPVVLKGRGRGIAHKTELGWVCTDVRSPDELRRLAHEMRSGSAGAHLEGFLVARRMTSGIELLVGLSHDPVLGPVITLGAGGVEAEIKRDTALSVLPLLPDRAEAMVNRLRISPLFDGWRGNPAIDRQPLVEVLLAMASLAVGGEAEEIDINPLLATPDGVVALDALVRIRR